jgi:Icc-related predicted phosphoesterase
MKLRIVCLSDIHSRKIQFPIPSGDVLIVAGDICNRGTVEEIEKFDLFLAGLSHQYKLVIAGNHDWPFARFSVENSGFLLKNGIYLQDSGIIIDGVKFWGSPWQRKYFDGAFDLSSRQELVEKWDKIPMDTDILITHTPPHGILDKTRRGNRVGCRDLAKIVKKISPKAHIFGHIHENAGKHCESGCIFVNASIRTKDCLPIVIDLE